MDFNSGRFSANFEEQDLMVVHEGAFHGIDFIGHPALDGIIVRYDSASGT